MYLPLSSRRSWLRAGAGAASLLLAGGWALPAVAATSAGTTTTVAPAPTPSVTWTVAHPPTSPPPLQDAAAAYDGDTRTVVLFGGRKADGTMSGDTWVWNGATWTDFPNSLPSARDKASLAFDPTLHQLILFGGEDDNGVLYGDTWAWNGQQWVQQDQAGPAPSPRAAAGFAYDPAGRLVLFGGTGSGPGAGTTTTTTTTTAGSTSTSVAAATPNAPLADTWQWTGTGWIEDPASGPPARSGAQMAYDSTTGTTVLFSGDLSGGGGTSPVLAGDTWTWDGAAWTAVAGTASSPAARDGAVFADDSAVGGPLLLAGAGSGGPLADTWLWSRHGWVETRATGSNPGPEAAGAGTYDAATSSYVLFGGVGAGGQALGSTDVVTAVLPPVVAPQVQPQPSPSTTTTVRTAGGRPTPTTPTTAAKTPTTTAPPPPPPTTVAPVLAAPHTMTLVANVHTVRGGATVQLSGSGFQPGSIVSISFHSTPALVGHSVADSNGAFTATVDVPRSASPGLHHFVAQGMAPGGEPTELVAAVFVLAPAGSHRPTPLQTGVMIGLALVLPAGAWTAMMGSGWWRRRRVATPTPG
jgi:hypothetical protein